MARWALPLRFKSAADVHTTPSQHWPEPEFLGPPKPHESLGPSLFNIALARRQGGIY